MKKVSRWIDGVATSLLYLATAVVALKQSLNQVGLSRGMTPVLDWQTVVMCLLVAFVVTLSIRWGVLKLFNRR